MKLQRWGYAVCGLGCGMLSGVIMGHYGNMPPVVAAILAALTASMGIGYMVLALEGQPKR